MLSPKKIELDENTAATAHAGSGRTIPPNRAPHESRVASGTERHIGIHGRHGLSTHRSHHRGRPYDAAGEHSRTHAPSDYGLLAGASRNPERRPRGQLSASCEDWRLHGGSADRG